MASAAQSAISPLRYGLDLSRADLRRLPNSDDPCVAYGMQPLGLFAIIRDRFLALVRSDTPTAVR